MGKEEKLRNDLFNKMQKEYDSFIDKLLTLPKEEIITHCYKKVMYEELFGLFYPEGTYFDIDEIKALNKIDKPLDYLYDEWLDIDANVSEYIKDDIADVVLELSLEQEKLKKKDQVR